MLEIFEVNTQKQERPKRGIVVDGSTRGNPGPSIYKGIDLESGKVFFENDIGYATNNICEYIALCHGIAYAKDKGLNLPVYSDSKTAIAWVKSGKIKTTFINSEKTKVAYALFERVKEFVKHNVLKEDIDYIYWETSLWGENPADYGFK